MIEPAGIAVEDEFIVEHGFLAQVRIGFAVKDGCKETLEKHPVGKKTRQFRAKESHSFIGEGNAFNRIGPLPANHLQFAL